MPVKRRGAAVAQSPRRRVANACLVVARSGHPLAGYAAPDLTSWQIREAAPTYMSRLRCGAPQHPSSQVAILNFLAGFWLSARLAKERREGRPREPEVKRCRRTQMRGGARREVAHGLPRRVPGRSGDPGSARPDSRCA